MKPKSLEQHEKHKRGICPHCGGNNDRAPKWYCSKCLEEHNRWARDYTKLRRSMGICPRCGDSMKKGVVQCDKCVVKNNMEMREARVAKKMKTTQ